MRELDHEHFMRLALAQVSRTLDRPFGTVIVERSTGLVLAQGWNKTDDNPILHAEIDAINQLAALGRAKDAAGLVLYTTAEPCPMCQGAILWTGIGAVVFGTSIRFLIETGWQQIDLSAAELVRRSPSWHCEVKGGVLETDCNHLFLAAARAAPGR